jgi:hypothetical protein
MIALLLMLAPQVALTAHYLDAAGASHQLKLWRDETHLRRDSDDKLQIFVEKERYLIVDRARGHVYHADREQLARVGTFPDFATLSSLGRPAPGWRRFAIERTAVGTCRWFGDAHRRVCWSEKWQLALILAEWHDDAWQDKLRVDALSASLPRGVFEPSVSGLSQIDVGD